MNNKLVYIVLLNYKGYEDTVACIESLLKIDYSNYKIVIVDNCSFDGSFERLKEKFVDCIFLLSPENRGFSAGNNLGIRYSLEHGADFVMMLNNDTVVEPDFLSYMMAASSENTVVTPTIYYYDEPHEIWYANGYINFKRCTVGNGSDMSSGYCNYASGCCLLMPRHVLETVGDWAEEFFMYYEDMDFSLRIAKAGFRIYYEKNAIVYHKAGRSSGRNSKLSIYYNVRNRLYIIRKYHFSLACYWFTLLSRGVRFIQGCLFKNNERIVLKAVVDFYAGKMGRQDL